MIKRAKRVFLTMASFLLAASLLLPKKARADSVNYFDAKLPNLARVEEVKKAKDNIEGIKKCLGNILSINDYGKSDFGCDINLGYDVDLKNLDEGELKKIYEGLKNNKNIANIYKEAKNKAEKKTYDVYGRNTEEIKEEVSELEKNLKELSKIFVIEQNKEGIKASSNICENARIRNQSMKSHGNLTTFNSCNMESNFTFNSSSLLNCDKRVFENNQQYANLFSSVKGSNENESLSDIANKINVSDSDVLMKSLGLKSSLDSSFSMRIEQSHGFKADMKSFTFSFCEKNSTLEERLYKGSIDITNSSSQSEFSQLEKKEEAIERRFFIEKEKNNKIGYYLCIGISKLDRVMSEREKTQKKEIILMKEEKKILPLVAYRINYEMPLYKELAFTPFLRNSGYGACIDSKVFHASLDSNSRKNMLFYLPFSHKEIFLNYFLKKEDISYGLSEIKEAELYMLEHKLFSSADGIILLVDDEKSSCGFVRKGYGIALSRDNARLFFKKLAFSLLKKDKNYSLASSLNSKDTNFSLNLMKERENNYNISVSLEKNFTKLF